MPPSDSSQYLIKARQQLIHKMKTFVVDNSSSFYDEIDFDIEDDMSFLQQKYFLTLYYNYIHGIRWKLNNNV